MGFLTFLKKKEPEVPKAPDFDLENLNTDLPDIKGAKLEDGMMLPSIDDSLNLTPLDDSMKLPSLDDSSIPDLVPFTPESDNHPQNTQSPIPEDLSRDINQLFLSDPGWKEPDWKEFLPYTEEKIEPPTMHDFGLELPTPVVEMPEAEQPQSFDIPEFSDTEGDSRVPDGAPYDVFVKGLDYKRVFTEISEIKEILHEQDTNMSKVVETFKKEESTINICKENMDYLYKRMLTIDKKVFT